MPYKYPSLRTTLPVAGYYARLDAGAAATDQFTADGAQDGTLTNGATRINDDGLAYSFDGSNDYLDFGTVFSFQRTNSFSFSFWMKATNESHSDIKILYSKTDTSGNQPGYSLRLRGDVTDDPFEVQIRSTAANQILIRYPRPNDTDWHHVCVTYSGNSNASGVALYIDGVAQTGTTSANTLTTSITNANPFNVASRTGGADWFFPGLIDDFLVYQVNLSSTNVGYLASQRGAIYQQMSGGSNPINGQSLIRPAGSSQPQLLIQGAIS
jgi:hypothetical protein